MGRNIGIGTLVLCMLTATIGLGYFVDQSDGFKIIAFYVLFFLAYIAAYKLVVTPKQIYLFIGTGVLLRFCLLWGIPTLSDDIYRFIWDGRLLLNGYNPFDHLPTYYLENKLAVTGINQALFDQLNSPEYFTIYPPVCQSIFAFACWLAPNSIWGSSLIMKLFLFAGELGTIYLIIALLKHFELPTKQVLLYTLNPLIIIEICGNLHFEGPMIFFLLLAVWFLVKNKINSSALAIAFSIASKLLPLMFLPLFIKRLGWKKSFIYFSIVGGTLVLLFLPLVSGVFVTNFGDSLNLYFQKFEFNASFYYLFRWIGFQMKGYNLIGWIGPRLAILTVLGILWMAFFEKEKTVQSLLLKMLFAITLYLCFTTTIHPWYTSLPLVLCLFTNFRYPVLWTGLISLTYINYAYLPYHENLTMVGIEYILVFSLLSFELVYRKTERLPLF